MADRVHFLGGVDDPADLLRAADAFVLPSVAEGMSNSLLEAMATSLPCLASAIGGNTDLLQRRARRPARPAERPLGLVECPPPGPRKPLVRPESRRGRPAADRGGILPDRRRRSLPGPLSPHAGRDLARPGQPPGPQIARSPEGRASPASERDRPGRRGRSRSDLGDLHFLLLRRGRRGRPGVLGGPVEQDGHGHVSQDVRGGPAAVEEPVDRQQHGDLVGGEAHGGEDQRERDEAPRGDPPAPTLATRVVRTMSSWSVQPRRKPSACAMKRTAVAW